MNFGLLSLLLLAASHCAFALQNSHVGFRDKRQASCPIQASPTTVKDCTYFVCAQQGDSCASLAATWGITEADFIDYNPVVGSSCSNFTVGEAYCVEENYGRGPATSSTSSSMSTTVTVPTTGLPSPTQTGLTKSCTRFYQVVTGDTCAGIVDKYHEFTLGDFYSWNPSVGSSCGNLLAGYYVCTAVPGTPSQPVTITTQTTTATGINPTQSGISPNCNKYYKVVSGDTCQGIVDKYPPDTLAEFYSWNPAVKSDCTMLLAGYYVCVGVKATSTTSHAPTSTKPSPTQSGLVSNCSKFYKAVSGDTCTTIAQKFCTFTVATFESWNPAVGSDCSHLLAGYYYCVGVPTTPTKCLSTTTNKPPPTSSDEPRQTGIAANCNKFYKVASGNTCATIEKQFGISDAQFHSWNHAINSGCTNLYLGYYVCVGVS